MDGRARSRVPDEGAKIRSWTRQLYSAASDAGCESPVDLTLDLLVALLTLAGLAVRRRRTRSPQIQSVADLSRAVEEHDPATARAIESFGWTRPKESLDSAVAALWSEIRECAPRVVAADWLGAAYEVLLASERSASGDRSRRRKGIYYTPAEVVDYIVARTVRRRRTEPITVLDPACGSGAFLLGAMRSLFRDRATRSGRPRRRDPVRSLFGVDSDARAVRLARVNLRLAAGGLSGCSTRDRLDDILSRQIVVGSALDEWAEGRTVPGTVRRAFTPILEAGGFDVVLGNPPYVKNKDLDPSRKQVWRRTYACARGQFDLLVLFIEQGLRLLRPGGRLGFLVSNKFMTATYGAALRRHLLDACRIEEIVDLSRARLFRDAAIYPTILILRRATSSGPPGGRVILRDGVRDLGNLPRPATLPQETLRRRPGQILTTALDASIVKRLAAVERRAVALGERYTVRCGLATAGHAKTLVEDRGRRGRRRDRTFLPFVRVENLAPYAIRWSGLWIDVDGIRASAARVADFRGRKIVIPGVRRRLEAAYDDRGYALGRVYYIPNAPPDPRLLLALLNSSLLDWYYRTVFGAARMAGGFLRFNGPYLRALPLPAEDPLERDLERIASLVDERIRIGPGAVGSGRVPSRATDLDRRIDGLVTGLYGLRGCEIS